MTPADGLFAATNVDGKKYSCIRMLVGFAKSLQEATGEDATVDQKDKPYTLSRLAKGWAIGTSDSGDVMYLDPADDCSVWVFHPDGGDVERIAKSFRAWRNKARQS